MKYTLKKLQRHQQAYGTKETIKASLRRLLQPAPQEASAPNVGSILSSKRDVLGFYNAILGHDHGSLSDLEAANPATNTIQWVIPNFGFGSGGHLNIFRFINALADRGFTQSLVVLGPHSWKSAEDAERMIEKWYFKLNATVRLDVAGFEPTHHTIATGWQTAYWVAKYQATREKFYFVQDFEPAFYATSSEYYFAENTYRLGLKGITAGTWLEEKLTRDYGMKCDSVSFSFDRDLYKKTSKRDSENFNIVFYARHVTQRRLFELGMCALEKVCAEHPDVAVIFAGGDVGEFHIPFHHLNCGELTLQELPDLYSQSDLALVLSGTNLSLLPLEVAACKCPLVMNDLPSARWLLPDDACYYAGMSPDEMAATLSEAIKDEKGRRAKADKAFDIALASSWDKESDKLVSLLTDSSK